jgi:hypothetical protein
VTEPARRLRGHIAEDPHQHGTNYPANPENLSCLSHRLIHQSVKT